MAFRFAQLSASSHRPSQSTSATSQLPQHKLYGTMMFKTLLMQPSTSTNTAEYLPGLTPVKLPIGNCCSAPPLLAVNTKCVGVPPATPIVNAPSATWRPVGMTSTSILSKTGGKVQICAEHNRGINKKSSNGTCRITSDLVPPNITTK